jgi:hypothetical protein
MGFVRADCIFVFILHHLSAFLPELVIFSSVSSHVCSFFFTFISASCYIPFLTWSPHLVHDLWTSHSYNFIFVAFIGIFCYNIWPYCDS